MRISKAYGFRMCLHSKLTYTLRKRILVTSTECFLWRLVSNWSILWDILEFVWWIVVVWNRVHCTSSECCSVLHALKSFAIVVQKVSIHSLVFNEHLVEVFPPSLEDNRCTVMIVVRTLLPQPFAFTVTLVTVVGILLPSPSLRWSRSAAVCAHAYPHPQGT